MQRAGSLRSRKKARCYDFIMALPDGFQTVVGEGGATLSGGEKQRISIARCILKDAPIVILDEATASVDMDNESYIQEAISELVRGKTLLVRAPAEYDPGSRSDPCDLEWTYQRAGDARRTYGADGNL